MEGHAQRLVAELRQEWDLLLSSGPQTNAALRTALASVLSLLAALWLHLDNPWWAAITGFVVVQQDVVATLSRSVDRAIGTIVGAVVGYAAAASIADHLLFQLICAACTAFAIYGQARIEHGYAILLGGVTLILVLFGSLAEPGTALHLAFYRAFEVLVGIAIACVVDLALAETAQAAATAPPRPGLWTRPVDRDLLSVALSGGIAVALIPWIWESLELPGLGQTPITAFIIFTTIRREPVWKAITRICGCLLGGCYGLLAMRLVGDAFLPWIVALSLGIFVSAHVFRGTGDASYVGMQAGMAMLIAMIQGTVASPDILPAIDRLIGIFGGILVVSAVPPLLMPPIRWALEPSR